MSSVQLEIKGQRVQFQPNSKVRLTTRKIFDKHYFWDDEYHHEIANHYRDFKQRPNLRRRRRNFAFVHQLRRSNVNGENSYKLREVLPMPVKDFSSFFAVYASRGRRTLCERQPPDATYNDTLRRIRNTHTIKEFEFLLQRQLRTSHIQRGIKANKHRKCANTTNRNKDKRNGVSSANKSGQQKCVEQQQSNACWRRRGNQQKRRSLGNLASVASAPKQRQLILVEKPLIRACCPHSEEEFNHTNKKSDYFAYYFQLAADYYTQGLLNNIEYLESIGTRTINAININKINKSELPTRKGENNSNSNNDKSITEQTVRSTPKHSGRRQSLSITSAKHTDKLSSPCPKEANWFELTSSIRSGTPNRKIFRQVSELQLRSSGSVDSSDDCHIRVNITPTNSKKPLKDTKTAKPNSAQANLETKTPKALHFGVNIMNDYLIANGNNTSKALQRNNNIKAAGQTTQEQQKFLELIDNLENLEIRACNSSLPKITLSNFCSDISSASAADRYAELGYCPEQPQQPAPATKAFILKEAKLDFNNSLDIPNENIYHSEARPP